MLESLAVRMEKEGAEDAVISGQMARLRWEPRATRPGAGLSPPGGPGPAPALADAAKGPVEPPLLALEAPGDAEAVVLEDPLVGYVVCIRRKSGYRVLHHTAFCGRVPG
eukprot:3146069-Lingulodinium_polyedra.AAC.1